MNPRNTNFSFKSIALLMVFGLFVAQSSLLANTKDAPGVAKLGKAESIAIAAKGLSKKLQNDLVLQNVSVKFNKAERYLISDTQIGIRGEGTCRLDNKANDLPLNFDVKIDVNKHSALDVKYVFLNMEGAVDANSAVTNEDVVTEKLLQRIKNDYKTENIVIAVEYLNDQTLENGEKGLAGGGEIQVNGMGWQKISFDVKAGTDKSKFSIVKYLIK